MANRTAVFIVNGRKDFLRFSTDEPKRIGDDAIAFFTEQDSSLKERRVRYLKGAGDATYLVDLRCR